MTKNTAWASSYEAIANDPRYRHFIRIPRRIIRCLELLGVSCDEVAVERRLRAYYLFIGVVDNAIDSGHPNASQSVLRQLETFPERSNESTSTSEIALATEGLKLEMSRETSSELLGTLRTLSKAVEHERTVGSMTDYIEVRKRVGQLTARASYVLIRPLLRAANIHVCRFMEQVGEIGCLVDSVIDLRADQRSGLLNFQSTPWEFIRLLTFTLKRGAQFSIRHPRLFGLFLEAVIDNLRDRPRARARVKRLQIPTKSAATTTT